MNGGYTRDSASNALLVASAPGSAATESSLTADAPARVASSVTVVTLLAANTSRRSAAIFNESTAILYVKHGATATITDYTLQIPALGYYELPFPLYRGIITGLWASANGAAQITEGT